MALWFPPWGLADTDSVEPDDFNQCLKELYGALTDLNDENFDTFAFGTQDCVLGAVYIIHRFASIDPTVCYSGDASPAYLPVRDGLWHTIGDDSTPWEINIQNSPGADLEIVCALQIQQTEEDYNPFLVQIDTRMQFALAVDGRLIPETITGSTEPQQDLLHDANTASSTRTEIIADDFGMIMIPQMIELSANVPITPGDHVITALVRLPPRARGIAGVYDPGDLTSYHVVKTGDFFAIQMVN